MDKFTLMVGAYTDKGNVREVNQDSILVKIGEDNNGDFGIFVVCDGLGGLSNGEVASKMAIIRFKKWWEEELVYLLGRVQEHDIQNRLVKIIEEINEKIIKYSRQLGSKSGTTVSLLFIYNNKYYIAHVGDSRIYSIRKNIVQLTEDHSYVAQKVRDNIMTKEEAKRSKERNILLQCVGVKDKLNIFTIEGEIHKDEVFIICSDGFYNKLEDKEVVSKIRFDKDMDNESLQNAANKLVNVVKNRGESDNISTIIVGIKDSKLKGTGNTDKLH